MTRRLFGLLAVLVLAGLLAGCGGGDQWVGTWRGERDVVVPPGADPVVAATFRRVEVVIVQDGTFTYTEGGIPMTGDADLGRNSAHLRVHHVLGRPERAIGDGLEGNRDAVLERQTDGSVILRNPSAPESGTVEMRRLAQPAGPGGGSSEQ